MVRHMVWRTDNIIVQMFDFIVERQLFSERRNCICTTSVPSRSS